MPHSLYLIIPLGIAFIGLVAAWVREIANQPRDC